MFLATESDKERERKGQRTRSFVHPFRFVLSFSGRWRWLALRQSCARRVRAKISTAYAKFMARYRARYRRFSCIFKNCTINEKAEKARRFTKYAALYPARVDELRSIGKVMSQSLSCNDKNIYLFIYLISLRILRT